MIVEHLRKNGYQWVDSEVFMVWDKFYDAPSRVGGAIYGTLEEALKYVSDKEGWEGRMVILRLPAITAYKLTV